MSKVESSIKAIFFVSSAAFGVGSAANPALAIPCALTGLAGNYSEIVTSSIKDLIWNKNGIDKQYFGRLCQACDKALQQVVRESEREQNLYNDTQRTILKELSEETVFPTDIVQLIQKTESYQLRYATSKEAEVIVKRFNTFFQYEISEDEVLCRYYTYTNGFYTLEHIKAIRALIEDDSSLLKNLSERVDSIQSQTGALYTLVQNGKKIFFSLMVYLIFIGIPTSIFLFGCIFLALKIDLNTLVYVATAFGVTEYFYFILAKRQYVIDFSNPILHQKLKKEVSKKERLRYLVKMIWSYFIYVTMGYGTLLLLSRALTIIQIDEENNYIPVLLLIMLGALANTLTKYFKDSLLEADHRID